MLQHQTEKAVHPCITQQQVVIVAKLSFHMNKIFCSTSASLAVSLSTVLQATSFFAGDQAGAVMLLRRHNASVQSKTVDGDSALHVAAAQGGVAAIQALLSEVRVSTSSIYKQQLKSITVYVPFHEPFGLPRTDTRPTIATAF